MDLEAQLMLGVRLLLALFLGGIIGLERERRGQDAGLGTFAMVTLGACVFSMVSDLVFFRQHAHCFRSCRRYRFSGYWDHS